MNRTALRIMLCICVVFRMHQAREIKEATCDRPGLASGTKFEPRKETYYEGEQVQYSCRPKGMLVVADSSVRRCLKNGSWTGKMPVCSRAINLERVQQSSEEPGKGAVLTNDGNISTCGQTSSDDRQAYWEGYLAISRYIYAIGITVPESTDSKILEVLIKADNSPDVKCSHFLRAKGTYTNYKTIIFYCLEDPSGKYIQIRSLSSILQICEVTIYLKPETFCNPPAPPLYGDVIYDLVEDGVPYNGTAIYKCKDGYRLTGSSTLRCVQQHKWDKEFPVCIKNMVGLPEVTSCRGLPYVINGELIYNTTSVGSIALLKCNDGHKPVSEDRVFCLGSGFWSSRSLQCSAIQCELNPYVPHGRVILLNNSTYYGSHLQILCNSGDFHEAVIRRCEDDGTWGNLDVCAEIVCGTFQNGKEDEGDWIQLNGSNSVHILVCPEGFHIEGGPPFVVCLSNGSWSSSAATCKSPSVAEIWGANWTPSLVFIAAVAIGAATAIFIVCSIIICIVIKKRRQLKTATTVFHLAVNDASYKDNKKESISTELSQYSKYSYDDVIELRPKSTGTNIRKPHSALPILPLDTDPVYAQPFENSSKNVLVATLNKDDLYNTHIYAEPIDARRQVTSMKQPLRHTRGTHDRKMSLTDSLQKHEIISQPSLEKKCAIYDSSVTEHFGSRTLTSPKQFSISDENIVLQTLTTNSEYITSTDLVKS